MPPIQSSLAWTVLAVVPVEGLTELPLALAALSSGLAESMPLYSTTTAAERSVAWLIVRVAAAPETLDAIHISVVEPPALLPCDTRVQVAPVWVIPVTLPVEVPRVAITATRVLPFAGATPMFTAIEEAALIPVSPEATRTRPGKPRIAGDPTFLSAMFALPVRERFAPSRLLVIVRIPAAARIVPS